MSVAPASEVVAMDDPVAVALRQKKDSSMRVAINQVKEGHAQAAVSAGNTGALMAVSRFVLKTLPGVDRPAICTAIPTASGHCHMLDLGANVDSEPEHLLQFAMMGQAVVRAVDGQKRPKVALLNIGEEDIKGNEQIKGAANLMQAAGDLNYVGFVEGNGIFLGDVDVVVCDGFVGNVSLKTMEGVAKMIGGMIREEAGRPAAQAQWPVRAAAAGRPEETHGPGSLQRRQPGGPQWRGGEKPRRHQRGRLRQRPGSGGTGSRAQRAGADSRRPGAGRLFVGATSVAIAYRG